MKKVFFLAIFAVLISLPGISQRLKAGIKAGVNLSKLDGQSFDDGYNVGYCAGGFVEIKINDKFYLQPEVLWSQTATKTDTSMSLNGIKPAFDELKDIKLNYLSIPILASYKISNLFSLQAGPQFGILLNNEESAVENGKDAFTKGDFSLLLGVQIHVSRLRVYGRYAIGLNDIADVPHGDKWKSQAIQLGVGFAF